MARNEEKLATVTYPGILQYEDWDFTDQAGIAPATGIMTVYPQPNPPALEGDIVMQQGTNRIVLRRMRVDKVFYQAGSGGQVAQVTFLDERWRWNQGYVIHGRYNTRLPDSTVDPLREKKPIELAELLIEAMDADNIDAGILESDPDIANDRPEVGWDVSNPAQELQRLCELYGLRIVPQRSTGKFVLCRTGVGGQLPEGLPYQDPSQGIDPKEIPDAVQVFGAPIRYQVRIELEAVGKEIYDPSKQPSPVPLDPLAPRPTNNADGSWKPVDQLTYIPTENGPPSWETEDEFCGNVSRDKVLQPDGTYVTAQSLAQQYIYRAWRIKPDGDGLVSIPGYVEKSIAGGEGLGSNKVFPRQIILTEETVDKYVNEDNSRAYSPAFCDFVGWHKLRAEAGNCPGGTRLDYQSVNPDDPNEMASFSIDAERGLVFTSIALRRFENHADGDAKYPARVFINCAVMIRDNQTGQPVRYSKLKVVPGATPADPDSPKFVLPIRADDITQHFKTTYNIDDESGDGSTYATLDNLAECDERADYYINCKLKEFEAPQALTRTYQLLVPLDLDGAIQQISYTISKAGANTKASVGTEHDFTRPSYRDAQQRVLRGKIATAENEWTIRQLKREMGSL